MLWPTRARIGRAVRPSRAMNGGRGWRPPRKQKPSPPMGDEGADCDPTETARGATPIRSTGFHRAGLARCRDRNDIGPIPSTLITVAFPARLTGPDGRSACSSPVHSALALALISQQNDQLSEALPQCVLVRFTAFVWHVFNCGCDYSTPGVSLSNVILGVEAASPGSYPWARSRPLNLPLRHL